MALGLGATAFLFNDFSYLIESPPAWALSDYLVRAVAVAACVLLVGKQALHLGKPKSILEAIGWLTILVAVSFTADHLLRRAFPEGGLWSYPPIDGLPLLVIDTAIGIPLVALSEELVARGAFLAWAERRGWAPGPIILGSAVLFAAFHWSLGTASIVAALLFGVIAMFSVLVTRSLWPAIAAHWAADLLLFSLPGWLNWMRWTAG